jgi:hypothetical protein
LSAYKDEKQFPVDSLRLDAQPSGRMMEETKSFARSEKFSPLFTVIPAKAGNQRFGTHRFWIPSRLRGNDV